MSETEQFGSEQEKGDDMDREVARSARRRDFTYACRLSVFVGVAMFAVSDAPAQDFVEFLSGTKVTGKVIEIRNGDKEFDFEVKIGSRTLTRTYSLSEVHAVTMKGKRYLLTPKQGAMPAGGDGPSSSSGVIRSKAEIDRLVNEMGTTPPDWFDAVSLNYPKSLDLSWPKPLGGWNAQKHISHYMFSAINENPRRWKEGTKFMHHVLSVNKDNPGIQQKAFGQLGHCYHDLIGDWARAAFWWQKLKQHDMNSFLGLADCYWKLGSKKMAAEQLSGIRSDSSRYGSAIKLWSDMGELDKALGLADASARNGNPGGAYIGAGDACRKHGGFSQAIAYYRKVLAQPTTYTRISGKDQKNPILERNKQRAQTAIDNIRTFETLDLSRIPDGTYTGTTPAYVGDLTVSVTVQSGRIKSVRVTKHKDKQYYTALTDTPNQIISKQRLKGIDATTGATITSQAIIDATAKALAIGAN